MVQNKGGPQVTSSSDARITRVGVFLRTWKLDEIPQFVNVLRGEMSLVGPRPEVLEYVRLYRETERQQILSVRPGLTDPATLIFRNEERMLEEYADPRQAYQDIILPEKLRLYVHYVETRSLYGDFLLLLRTVAAIFRR